GEQAGRRRHELPRRAAGDRVGSRSHVMTDPQVREQLARISARPAAEWEQRVRADFPGDATLRAQALLWLHAERHAATFEGSPPSLGEAADERYELTVRLDRGASSSVWQAFDRHLGRN